MLPWCSGWRSIRRTLPSLPCRISVPLPVRLSAAVGVIPRDDKPPAVLHVWSVILRAGPLVIQRISNEHSGISHKTCCRTRVIDCVALAFCCGSMDSVCSPGSHAQALRLQFVVIRTSDSGPSDDARLPRGMRTLGRRVAGYMCCR